MLWSLCAKVPGLSNTSSTGYFLRRSGLNTQPYTPFEIKESTKNEELERKRQRHALGWL